MILLTALIVTILETKVGVKAIRITQPEKVAYALAWTQQESPLLVTKSDPTEVLRILNEKYCMTATVVKRSRLPLFKIGKSTNINWWRRTAQAGYPVLVGRVQRAPNVKTLGVIWRTVAEITNDDGSSTLTSGNGGTVSINEYKGRCGK